MTLDLHKYYRTSDQVITRKIEGELIIVPLSDGVGDLDAEMFSLNSTGAVIWEKLDGKTPLEDVIQHIADNFNAPHEQIKKEVLELMEQLLNIGFVVSLQ